MTSVAAAGSSYTVTVNTPGETSWPALYAFTGAARPRAVVGRRQPAVQLDGAARRRAGRSSRTRFSSTRWRRWWRRGGSRAGRCSSSICRTSMTSSAPATRRRSRSATSCRRFTAAGRRPPRFVLLVGDASFDPRNFLGQGDFDFAPTKLIDTQQMETASDDWFVDWNADGVPDIAIGRLSVRTAAEASTVVGKIVGYGGVRQPAAGRSLRRRRRRDRPLLRGGQPGERRERSPGLMPTSNFFLSQPTSTEAALLPLLDEGRSWSTTWATARSRCGTASSRAPTPPRSPTRPSRSTSA